MIKKFNLFFTSLVLLTQVFSFSHVSAQNLSKSKFDSINTFINEELSRNSIPGLSLGIIKEDRVVYTKGFGKDHKGEEIKPETSFMLASNSKPLTAFGVMLLADKGMIELDTPVKDYISWFTAANTEKSNKITVRHLLTHYSGIANKDYRLFEGKTLEEHVRSMKDLTVQNEPGSTFEYSSANYQILGVLIENVAKQTFQSYMQENVFTPLEMNDTFTSYEEALKNGMTKGHNYWFGFPKESELEYYEGGLPNGFIISSSKDMLNFLSVNINKGLFKDKRILSEKSINEMQNTPNFNTFHQGLGWRMSRFNDISAVWHGGTWGNFLSETMILPDSKYGIVVLANGATYFDTAMTERIVVGVASILQDKSLPAKTERPIWQKYLIVNAILLIILFFEAKSYFNLKESINKSLKQKSAKNVILTKAVLPLLANITVLILLFSKSITFIPFDIYKLLTNIPDIGYFIILLILSSIAKALLTIYLVSKSA